MTTGRTENDRYCGDVLTPDNTQKTETGEAEELNSEGNKKRRRQRERRVNSGVEKKSSDKHWHKKKTMHMFGMVDEQ